MSKLIVWAPFRGNIGTVAAVKNYARIYAELGYQVVFIELCDEWSAVEDISRLYRIRSLSKAQHLKNIGKSNFFRRRDFFIYQFLRLPKLARIFADEKPDLIISFLGIVPAVIANYFCKFRHFGSVQGFPRFLNQQAPVGPYYKIEDRLRRFAWKFTYNKLDKILCMTPRTALELGNFLKKETLFIPNPLFLLDNSSDAKFDKTQTFDFIFVGRNSYQKRIDLILWNFSRILAVKPDARLHFFGDVLGPGLIKEFPAYETIIQENCCFYGFRESIWATVLDELNPIHLVASQWEDPGHAILEGLWHKVPTLFLNREGEYTQLYLHYGAVMLDDPNWDGKVLSQVICRAADGDLRLHLKMRLAAQFTVQNVKVKLGELVHV